MATILLAKAIAGANMFWGAVISMAAGAVDSYLFGSLNRQSFEGSRMNDLRMQTSSDGAKINRVWGTARVNGNVIWGTDYREHKKTKKQGKGGGGAKTTEYSYSISFGIGICEGPIAGVRRVWADGNLWKDFSGNAFNEEGIIDIPGEDGKFSSCRIYQGTEAQQADDISAAVLNKQVPAYRGLAYIVFKDLYVDDFGRRLPSFTFEIVQGGGITSIKEIIQDVCKKAGMEKETDTGYLEDKNFQGYVSTAATPRETIEDLQKAFKFDVVERGIRLWFMSRDTPLFGKKIWTLSNEDYGAYESEAPTEPYQITRAEERELPKEVTLNFSNFDKEYQNGAVTAQRVNTISSSEVSISSTLVISEVLAKQIAESILWGTWEERNTYELSLTSRFAAAMPGDVLYMPLADGRRVYATIIQTNYGKPGINKIKAISKHAAAHIKIDRPSDENDIKKIPDYITDFSYICREIYIPQYGPIMAVAVAGNWTKENENKKFGRFVLYKSEDDGLTWDFIAENNTENAIGDCLTKLNQCVNACLFDEANTIEVKLRGREAELDSRPERDILNSIKYNICLIGNEIIQFKQAVLVAGNTYKISGLLRGRFGTEDEIKKHKEGETFFMLDETALLVKTLTSQELYRPVLYRIGPACHPINAGTYKEFSFTAGKEPYMPYSVCRVTGKRSATGLSASWTRRSRTDYTWKPYVDNELGEEQEAYELDIIGAGGTVLRTMRTTEPKAEYTTEQQIEDFGEMKENITVRIYQMSAVIGRGKVKEVTL